MSCIKVHQGKVGECVYCELKALREKVVEICTELEWYATRKIDLAKITPVSHKPWADMLLEDIAELRNATQINPLLKQHGADPIDVNLVTDPDRDDDDIVYYEAGNTWSG